MFIIALDLDLAIDNVNLCQDVTSQLNNICRPVKSILPMKAIVIDPSPPGGVFPVVELTFRSKNYARAWMVAQGMDDEDIDDIIDAGIEV